jgi:hypothetical protein
LDTRHRKIKASINNYRNSSDFFSEKHPKNEKKQQTAEKIKGLNGIGQRMGLMVYAL